MRQWTEANRDNYLLLQHVHLLVQEAQDNEGFWGQVIADAEPEDWA
jgi:hypothetical protein